MSRVLFLYEPTLLDEGELAAVRATTNWVTAESVLDVEPGDLVIARHTMWPWPRRVERDVVRRGGQLLNGLRSYVYADSCASWSYDLAELTPRTWTDLSRLPDDGTEFILKGAKADKSNWRRMWAPSRAAAMELLVELHRDPRFNGQDIVAREYVPLERLGDEGPGCPASTEFRVFVLDGEMLSAGFYWHPDDCNLAPPPRPEVIPQDFLRDAMGRIGDAIRYYTLDCARTAQGNWIVIEISDGQRAGLSANDPAVLYRHASRALEKTP